MTFYSIEFTGKVEEYGVVELEAVDSDEAENFAREHVAEAYPEYQDVSIDSIKEIVRNG